MRPTSAPAPENDAAFKDRLAVLPRFWRIQYADLLELWGEEGAKQVLRAMERAYDNQVPEYVTTRKMTYRSAGVVQE